MKGKKHPALRMTLLIAAPLVLLFRGAIRQTSAQEQQQGVEVDRSGQTPVYRVRVVARSTPAINYQHRSGKTEVNFRGTDLMPQARGQIIVNSKEGRIAIKAHMAKLTPATQFGRSVSLTCCGR